MVAEWVWDPVKDKLNLKRHKFGLAAGIPALDDHLAQSVPDPHPDGDRIRTVGCAIADLILFVVHDGEEVGRIISVRRATAQERKAYEEGTAKKRFH